MTTSVSLTWTGLEEFLEQVAKIDVQFDDDIKDALSVVANQLQDEMRTRVPKDTGNLMAHIVTDGPHQVGTYIYVDVGVIHKQEFTDDLTALYGNVMEYGSVHVSPRPYIRPSIASMRRKFRSIIIRELGNKTGLDFK